MVSFDSETSELLLIGGRFLSSRFIDVLLLLLRNLSNFVGNLVRHVGGSKLGHG